MTCAALIILKILGLSNQTSCHLKIEDCQQSIVEQSKQSLTFNLYSCYFVQKIYFDITVKSLCLIWTSKW